MPGQRIQGVHPRALAAPIAARASRASRQQRSGGDDKTERASSSGPRKGIPVAVMENTADDVITAGARVQDDQGRPRRHQSTSSSRTAPCWRTRSRHGSPRLRSIHSHCRRSHHQKGCKGYQRWSRTTSHSPRSPQRPPGRIMACACSRDVATSRSLGTASRAKANGQGPGQEIEIGGRPFPHQSSIALLIRVKERQNMPKTTQLLSRTGENQPRDRVEHMNTRRANRVVALMPR